MASPKQARGRGTAARGAGAGTNAKKSTTRGGRPDAQPSSGAPSSGAPSGAAARGNSGGQARRANGATARPSGGSQAQRDKNRPAPGQSAATAARGTQPVVADATLRAPLWLQITTLVLALGGLGVSIYLTIAHYDTAVTLACSDKGLVNCTKVTTSPESIVFGIPVAVLGLAFFVFMVAANTPWAWRARLPAIRWARLASVIVGIGFVLYLVYSEVVTIGSICLWCTSVHVITFLLFGLIVFSATAGYGVKAAAGQRSPARR
jgi:uncharacterized membrane protein